jgi:quercetin dioxygenase-like cupin family protein
MPDGDAHVVCVRLGPGGVLGRHPAAATQAFIVIQGEGWVSGPEGERRPVVAGTVVFWDPGEEHESGSDSGLTALVVESGRLAPAAL